MRVSGETLFLMVSDHDRVAFTLFFFSNFIFGCTGSSLLRVGSL